MAEDLDPRLAHAGASPDAALALGVRAGLPETARILCDKHPREGWAASGRMGALADLWLDRHMMFRDLLARLVTEAEGVLDRNRDPRGVAMAIEWLGRVLGEEMQNHQLIEDERYFPALRAREGRLARAFDLLEADHQALEAEIFTFIDTTTALLERHMTTALDADAAGPYFESLRRFSAYVDQHIVDEEEVVVPILIEHGEEWLS